MAGIFDYPVLLFKMLFVPNKEKVLHFHELGWTITLPKKFRLQSAKQIKAMTKRYKRKLLEKTSTTLKTHFVDAQFWAEYDIINKFGCSIVDLNREPEREWKNRCNETSNAMLNYLHAFYKEYAYTSIVTEQGERQKGDIVFETMEIAARTSARLLHCTRYYTTIYKNHGILITMSFAEEKIGDEMLNMLRSSTFS